MSTADKSNPPEETAPVYCRECEHSYQYDYSGYSIGCNTERPLAFRDPVGYTFPPPHTDCYDRNKNKDCTLYEKRTKRPLQFTAGYDCIHHEIKNDLFSQCMLSDKDCLSENKLNDCTRFEKGQPVEPFKPSLKTFFAPIKAFVKWVSHSWGKS
jgi:hypothetical protein